MLVLCVCVFVDGGFFSESGWVFFSGRWKGRAKCDSEKKTSKNKQKTLGGAADGNSGRVCGSHGRRRLDEINRFHFRFFALLLKMIFSLFFVVFVVVVGSWNRTSYRSKGLALGSLKDDLTNKTNRMPTTMI